MSFKPPVYEHCAYYVFHKATGQIVHSHRFLTLAGDDTVMRRVSAHSIIAEASKHSGQPETVLDVLVETGPPKERGWIAGVDVKLKKLIIAASPSPMRGRIRKG
jgi:hypothetical protein